MGALAELYKTSLIRAIGHQALVFDYGADFYDLWGEAEDSSPEVLSKVNETQVRFVIVWDGKVGQLSPDGTKNLLARHLTPLDWALALSIKMLADGTAAPPLSLRIHIVDLTRRTHDEWSLMMRHTLLAEMPWVTLHAPLIPMTEDGAKAAFRTGYEPIVGGLFDLDSDGAWFIKSLGRSPSLGAAKNLVNMAQQWAATLTHSDEHHDLNNVIGPSILACDDYQKSGLTRTLLTRLSWCNQNFKALIEWSPWPAAKHVENELFGRPLSLLIVDDQLRHGWGRFACELLDEEFNETAQYSSEFTRINDSAVQKVRIFGSISSDPLIKFLHSASFNGRDFSSQIINASNGELVPELIFLDLRLYANSDDAKKYAQKLLGVIEDRVSAPLAWPAIDKNELERIKKWSGWQANHGLNNDVLQESANPVPTEAKIDDAHIADEALLLLPRLLALALPLTPIILFSSTGQTWIRERLKPYRNVFTAFEKPRVLSNPESIKAAIDALKEGLIKAVDLMRLRLQLAHAQLAYRIAANCRPSAGTRTGTKAHIEIYADESGKPEITSGMAVCVYRDQTAAESLQTALMNEFATAGIVWATRKGGGTPKLNKGESLIDTKNASTDTLQTEQVDAIASLLDGHGIGRNDRSLWSVVATKTKLARSINNVQDVSLAAFPDASLDTAIRFNLEFTIFVLIPYLIMGDKESTFNGTIQIRLPTRIVPKDKQVAQALCDAFDLGNPFQFGTNDPRWFIQTYSSHENPNSASIPMGSAFPLVRGWLHEWRNSEVVKPNCIQKIKITSLGRGTKGISDNQASARRLFNDIADWACSASTKRWKNDNCVPKFQRKMSSLFPNWFVSTDLSLYEHDFSNALLLMRAMNASCSETRIEGKSASLRLMLQNSYLLTCDDRLISDQHCVQQRVILWMLRHEIETASGQLLHSLLHTGPPTRNVETV